MLKIFIGYDSREPIAYHVLSHSIIQRATRPVSITPLIQDQLRGIGAYTRERCPTESTDFSLTRFLVPYLSDYEGISLFLDCDMLCLDDIADLEFEAAKSVILEDSRAVWVCKHDYTPLGADKFLGQKQTAYPRKNWSSLMLFDNAKCKSLTPDYVNTASGLDLHRFNWMPDEQIGCLPLEWNWLVGEYPDREAKMLHYTLGGPWFPDCKSTMDAPWFEELDGMRIPS